MSILVLMGFAGMTNEATSGKVWNENYLMYRVKLSM